MENTVKQRLIEFLKAINEKASHFETKCGFANGYLYALKDMPSTSRLTRILEVYPQLNRVWLLTGEGDMLNDGTKAPREPEIIELDGRGFGQLLRIVEDHDIRFHQLADRILDAMGAPEKKEEAAS